MNKRLLLPLVCGLLVAPAATAEIITVSPWHTAGNGNPTDLGGWFQLPNVGLYHQAKAAFGGGPVTASMVIQSFDVSALSATSIPAGGGSVTFTVTFTPMTGGTKTAALQIASNITGTKNPFDIALTATALGTGQDTDNDGLNDLAEYQMAALGFDWQVAQTALVESYFATANGAGLFQSSQVQALKLPTPQIQRDPLTGEFTLGFGLGKSATLDPAAFSPFPVTAPQVSIGGGKLEILLPGQGDAAFFRLSTQ